MQIKFKWGWDAVNNLAFDAFIFGVYFVELGKDLENKDWWWVALDMTALATAAFFMKQCAKEIRSNG